MDDLTKITLSLVKDRIPNDIRIVVTMTTEQEGGDLVIEKEFCIDRDRIMYLISQVADYLSKSAHDMTIAQLFALITQVWTIIKPHIRQDSEDEAGADSNINKN